MHPFPYLRKKYYLCIYYFGVLTKPIATDPDDEREYVIHLSTPRFIGMILAENEFSSGVTLALRDEIVGHLSWIDPPPSDLLPLFRPLQEAMDRYLS